ncbi:LysM peptidoglycan-binding domain-containing protein [Agromyces aerolatus]|uniref:LysM peptidoglycan-binding domain-containing protein n=1 Tax=Agromyces sp. LY-1074 TaxID=3074080 RepID=UPI0028669010|nr:MULTISPECIES: LysM peptidoglycan-binding domain-containing protein [unclassified Agromyces]MDR5701010.1 LysM peptidoglycan-binding domain-containing protein [Agromyces sp. LY-1074]MDR5707650.1 LysM peptidoglycan-binding domain-containing protein [Agromyces sp. LY-1358]
MSETTTFGAAPRTRLRLTRRGRAVLTTLAALPIAVFASVSVLGAGVAAADGGDTPVAPLEVVTVGHGDTLWELAESIAPEEDPREVIADIVRLNGLGDAVVQPGQKLALPAHE